ncbi:DUF6456 domain-containing protein [Aquamicrobium zhengzhouense]|uniref:DUF6456 domain-containing protein n=1 Tax=Aquamicrobium zhengzhouense TaxID=2781738 RepID=A0ABS0SDV6_9HYPH|nr:DUF6456 domain-containing protein [Aquamicrobium zhengzhouense]MBI1621484.1 hypothetical protein [Aquamicrobium zhengzhouense]
MSKKTQAKQKRPTISQQEKEQVRARRAVGHFEALHLDQFGRYRLAVGTAEASRQYDLSKGGIVRVRNVDPLKGILSLTQKQREAGERYRADFELAAREGLKTGTVQERVDGGGVAASIADHLIDNHKIMAAARDALVYPEIVSVMDAVCGMGMSLKEVAERANVVRDIPSQLLRMGLERLVLHYSQQGASRHG